MKNEPAITYNHMQDDTTSNSHLYKVENEGEQGHPISLYMILVVDLVLMGALAFFAFNLIF